MCHFIIELQEAVRSQASFLELLENRTPIIIRNSGTESDKAKEHLKTVAKYKLDLISRKRELSDYIAINNGVNLSEPCDLAMLVNNAIDNISELVTSGVINNNLQAIASYIRDNEYSFNKTNSQVSSLLIEHYSNHDFSNDESEEVLAEEASAEEEALPMTYYFYALHNGKIYPSYLFNGYSKKDAIAKYKAKYNLKYKRNVKLYNAMGGTVFN